MYGVSAPGYNVRVRVMGATSAMGWVRKRADISPLAEALSVGQMERPPIARPATQEVPLSHVGFTRAAWQGRDSTIYQSEALRHRLLPASLQVVGDFRKLSPARCGTSYLIWTSTD